MASLLEMDLMPSTEFLASLVSLCPDGIIGVDRRGIIILFNEAAEALTGMRCQDVLGKVSITEVYNSPSLGRDIKKMLYSPQKGGVGRLDGMEVEVKSHDGKAVPIRLSAVLLVNDGEEVGSVGFFHDLTQRKELEMELRRLSITDGLTGLYNRRHFHAVMAEEVARSERYNRPLSLVCFDLDNFKPFNDHFGHQEGDTIIKLVAECAGSQTRAQDFAFRYGGDEFALLLVETDLEGGFLAAERFRQAFARRWPVVMNYLQSDLEPVTMSMGVAQFVPGENPDVFIKRSDLAMYEAKKSGGGCTVRASDQIGRDQASATC